MLADKLKIGDTIGVIAPDKALKSSDEIYLKRATNFFESIGLKVKYGNFLFSDENYCAGSPKQRAQDINNMFSDKDIKAIFTVKGGELVNGVLPFIDFDNIKNNPKMFLGMSDITVLLCAINKMTNLITYHCNDYIYYGKKEVTEYDKNEIIDKLFNGNRIIIPYEDRKFINFKDKIISGKCYGTNVKDLLKLLGTSYMPDLSNSILFLEAYRTDIIQWNTLLEQYKQIGILNNAVVLGYIYQIQHEEKNKYSVENELMKINSEIPIVKTNDFGHKHANSIIPIGANIKIDSINKSIIIMDEYVK